MKNKGTRINTATRVVTEKLILLALCCFAFGCEPTAPEISVSINGNGKVTSQPEGINCSLTDNQCSYMFEQQEAIILTAQPDPGYVFTGWQGDCSGIEACEFVYSKGMEISASFTMEGGDIISPTRVLGVLNVVDSTELSIGWDPSSDDTTGPDQLTYKVFLSENKENLTDEANLVEQLAGNEDLYIEILDAQPDTLYFATVIAVDESLNESTPIISSARTPLETPSMRDDVITYAADEQDWGIPTHSEDTGLYTFNFSSEVTAPEIGNFIAIPVEDLDETYDLTAVLSVETESGTTIVTARPALLFEISDDIKFSGSIDMTANQGTIKLTTPEAQELAKKKASKNLPYPEKFANAENIGNSQSLIKANNDPVALIPAAVLPEPDPGCNTQPTTELDFDAYATPDLILDFNFSAAGMGICPEEVKNEDGDCPDSQENFVLVKGNISLDSHAKISLENQECVHQKYSQEIASDSFNFKKWKWLKKLKKVPLVGKKLLTLRPQLKFQYELNTHLVYSGTAKSDIETAANVHYGINDIEFGVKNLLNSADQIFQIGNTEHSASASADLKGDLDFDIYVIPSLEFTLDAFGQIEIEWIGDVQVKKFGLISTSTPDPLFPLDIYFEQYILGANITCYDSLFVDVGIFGLVPFFGDFVNQEYENQEFCDTENEIFYAMPFFQSSRPAGQGQDNGTNYLISEYLYTNPPLNPVDWSTAEYGIMLLNGEMIKYPTIFQPTYYYSTHQETGWDNLVIPVWIPFPIPNDVLPPNYVKDTGGGQKFWIRAETNLGRKYIYLSDWSFVD